MKIGAAYIRVSTDEQTDLSPETQIKLIKEFAQKNEIIVPDEFIFQDLGISGKKAEKRPAFVQMIALTKERKKPFEIILIWKFSRFARNQDESIFYKSILKKNKVELVSISEPIEDSPFGKLNERIIEWMDEYYSIRLAGEVKRGMKEKAIKGEYATYAPFGYIMKDKQLIIDEEKAPIVQKIFNDYLNGKGFYTIAREISDLGFKTKFGNPLENRFIEYILKNPVYIGKIVWSSNGKRKRSAIDENNPDIIISQGKHQPIISEEIFNKVQEKIKEQKKLYGKCGKKKSTSTDYTLRSLIKCGNCGTTLSRSLNGMNCSNFQKGRCRISHYISAKEAETMLITILNNDYKSNTFLNYEESSKENVPTTQEEKIISQQIEKEQNKLLRIKEAFENEVYTLEEYKISKNKILNNLDNLKKKLKPKEFISPEKANIIIKRNIKKALEDMQNPNLSETSKNISLRQIISKIIYNKNGKEKSFDIIYKL